MNQAEKEKVLEKIYQLPDDSFDGHTNFKKMSAPDKMKWLSACVRFLDDVSKENNKPGLAKKLNIP